MPRNKQKNINLIPLDEFESSTLGRILKWALSSFRVMVIVTEIAVMGAFLSRFWLDARNSDLNDEIEVGQAQIAAYEDVEKEIKSVQKKIRIVSNLYNQKPKSTSLLESLSTLLPPDIMISTISLNASEISIKGSSSSENSIAQFISNLQSNNSFADINLNQITTLSDDPTINVFTLTGKVKTDGK